MGKDQEWSGLMKIPEEVVIKELRIELGKRKSEIDELNHRLGLLQSVKISQKRFDKLQLKYERQKEITKELTNEKVVLNAQLKGLSEKKVSASMIQSQEAIIKNHKAKYQELNDRFIQLVKENERLQRQLITSYHS